MRKTSEPPFLLRVWLVARKEGPSTTVLRF